MPTTSTSMPYVPRILATWARVAWENGNSVSGVRCLPFGSRMAYTTIVGLKFAARFQPRGSSAAVLTKRSRTVDGPATRLCAETRPWENRWLSGADPSARLTWMSSLPGPSRSQISSGLRAPSLGRPQRPQADGDGHGPELGEDVLAVLATDVGQHVPVLVPGPQELPFDVDAVLGEHAVDRGQHAGHVPVQVDQAVRPADRRQREPRQVDAQRGGAGGHVVGQLPGDELADVLLG